MTKVDCIFGAVAAIEYGTLFAGWDIGTPAARYCYWFLLTALVAAYVWLRPKGESVPSR